MKTNGLTEKQRIFIDEYLITFNATEAAKRAGYSKKTAYAIGFENLKKPDIAKKIKARLSESHMSAEEVLERLADRARFDVGEYVNDYGKLAGIDLGRLIADGHGKHIKGLKQTAKGGTVVEFYDSDKSLELIGKAHALFRTVIAGDPDAPIITRVVEQR